MKIRICCHLEEYIKDLKEPPQQHEREIATLEEATNIIREHEKHAGILEKIKEGVAAKEKVIRVKDEQLEKIKNKHDIVSPPPQILGGKLNF